MRINHYLLLSFAVTICTAIFFAQIVTATPLAQGEQWFPLTGNSLPTPLAIRDAVYRNGFIYIVGGRDTSGNPVSTVSRSKITTGVQFTENWISMTPMPRPLYSHAVVASNNYLYVIGGWDSSKVRGEVLRAQFASDGSLGAWSELAFPIRIQVHDAAILNGYIYVVGGADNTGKLLDRVYYAKIQPNGDLGAWQQTTHLPNVLYRHSVAAANGYLYVMGGFDDQTVFDKVYYAKAQPDGTLGNWVSTNALPQARYYAEAVARSGQLVVVGGRNNTDAFSDVQAATINQDGSLGNWQALTQLPAPRNRFAAVVGKLGQIYVMGGLDSATNIGTNNYHKEVYVLAAPGSVTCNLTGDPIGYLKKEAKVTYTIACTAGPTFGVSNVVISNTVPSGLELVPNSVTDGGTVTGNSQINWSKSALNPNETMKVSYQAKRPKKADAITSDPSGLTIHKIVTPTEETINVRDTITYTLVVTNSHTATISGTFTLTDVLPTSVLPITHVITATTTGVISPTGSIFVNVRPAVSNGTSALPTTVHTVTWTVSNLTLAANQVITAYLPATVIAAQTISNATYLVRNSSGVYHVTGNVPVVVYAGPDKDKFSASNLGATAKWDYQDPTGANKPAGPVRSNTVVNSAPILHIPMLFSGTAVKANSEQ